jgi:hypothetical protein
MVLGGRISKFTGGTGRIAIVAKKFSNRAGPGQCAKIVDKPTSNVATRHTRTTRGERPQTPTGSIEPERFSQTGRHAEDPNLAVCPREGSLTLSSTTLASREKNCWPPFFRGLSPAEAGPGNSCHSGRRTEQSTDFVDARSSVKLRMKKSGSKIACSSSGSGLILRLSGLNRNRTSRREDYSFVSSNPIATFASRPSSALRFRANNFPGTGFLGESKDSRRVERF